MRRLLQYAALFLGSILLIGCENSTEGSLKMSGKIYVIVPDGRSSLFTSDLASIVSRYGLVPNLGRAVDDKGMTLHVLDAKGPNFRLRSENVLLSGQEDSNKCGIHREPYPDPGQYFISLSHSDSSSENEIANELLENISSDLVRIGYVVKTKPELCSAYRE